MWSEKSRKSLVLSAVVILGATAFAGCFGPPAPPPDTNVAPVATASASQSLVKVGDLVDFTGTGSDSDGTISSWRWNFGDGGLGSRQSMDHSYTHQGTYYATLMVTDNGGKSFETIAAPIRLTVLPYFPEGTADGHPLADLALWQPSSVVTPGTSLSWSAAGSAGTWSSEASEPGTLASYRMDFGDGTTETHDKASLDSGSWNGNFTHTYAAAGSFAAQLTVTTTAGMTDRAGWTVIVIPSAVTPGIKNPDSIIIETIGQASSLDPAVAYDTASGEVIQGVYETLVTYNGNRTDDFVPWLAVEIPTEANGLITNGGMTYTFHIRQNVRFHSGTTLNASDVVYSFKRVLIIDDPGGPAWILSQVLNESGIVQVDDFTVQFNLERAYGPFISALAYTVAAIVSEEYVEAHGGVVAGQQNQWMNEHADGTGPWVFRTWVSGVQIVMDKNPNYWNPTAYPKQLSHVTILYKNEFSTRLLDLRSGNADIIYVPSANRPDAEAVAAIADEKIAISKGDSTWAVFVGAFNYAINVSQRGDIGTVEFPDNVPSDFFADREMRKAFSLAFDYDDYIANVAKGLAFRLAGIIPRGMYGYNPDLAVPQFDIEGAKAAYNASKWVTDGVYNPGGRAGGFSLTIGYNTGNVNRERAVNILKAGVEQLGPNIHLNSKGFIFDTYLSITLQTPSGEPGPLGVFFIGWAPDYADPDDYVVPFCLSGATYPQFTGFSNTTLDNLINQAGGMANSPTRLDLYNQIQESIINEYAFLQVTEAKNFHVAKTWVKGWYYNPMFSGADQGGNLASLYKE